MLSYFAEDKEISTVGTDLPSRALDLAIARRVACCDIETTGLDWQRDIIGTIQLFIPPSHVFIVRPEANFESPHLCRLLESSVVRKVFHHALFDLKFMVHHWRFRPVNIACTKVASKLLEPNAYHGHHLRELLAVHLGVRIDKHEQTSDWTKMILDESQVRYAAEDVLHLYDLLERLEKQLDAVGRLELARACFAHIPTRLFLETEAFGDVFAY